MINDYPPPRPTPMMSHKLAVLSRTYALLGLVPGLSRVMGKIPISYLYRSTRLSDGCGGRR